jgi:hypothetical protein
MYFNVYADTGDLVEGYLIPDGFSAKPEIMVCYGGETQGIFPCDIFLAGPYDHKHHATGVVGFSINEKKLPGLSLATALEIADADTGLVFYRRLLPEQHIQKRLFRLETQFAPHQELDRSMKPFFQFYAAGADRYGSETVRQMLEISNQPSSYVSGRVMLKSVERYFTGDTLKIASLRDPFYELAIRLWSIGAFKKHHLSFVSERDAIFYGPAMAYLSDFNFTDYDDVRKKIRSAPKELLTLFESPFTHQLVAASPSDKVSRDGVSPALDALSQFTIFDPNETDQQIVNDIAELLGVDSTALTFAPTRSPFKELADSLRDLPIVEQMLERDLILSHFIKKAAGRAVASHK